MEITRERVIKEITTQLDEALESINAEIYRYNDKIVDVDLENQTITIKFDYYVVEEDNYIGLSTY
jgi:hypothetical protein